MSAPKPSLRDRISSQISDLKNFYLPRFLYRLRNRSLSSWDVLLILESMQKMQLGKYFHHPPRPVAFDKIKKSRTATRLSFAIVTPCFNQASFVEETMTSVFKQDYEKVSYAVIDGGSTDGSVDVIRRHLDKVNFFVSEADQGQTDAIVKGFSHVQGDIMAYLNSDDLLCPGALRTVASFFARHPDVDVVYSHRIIIDQNSLEVGRWVLPRHDYHSTCFFDFIPQETMFWRRSLYEKVGGLDRRFHYAMDWDLILRFQEAGARFRRLPLFLGCFRAHPAQKSQSRCALADKEIHELMQRSGSDCTFGPEFTEVHKSYRRRAMLSLLCSKLGIPW